MSKLVTELHIIGENGNMFDTDMEYIIPLYQRAYAWEDKQLTQLIEDINDVAEDSNYYIGSLIVSKQFGRYEVVDGQQRPYLAVFAAELPWNQNKAHTHICV